MSIHKQTYETGPPLEPVIHWCFRCAQLLFDTIHTCIGCDIESGVRLYKAKIVCAKFTINRD